MCIDGFVRNTITVDQGEEEDVCMRMHCHPGERMVTNFNGIVFCEPIGILNCQQAVSVTVLADDDDEDEAESDDTSTTDASASPTT